MRRNGHGKPPPRGQRGKRLVEEESEVRARCTSPPNLLHSCARSTAPPYRCKFAPVQNCGPLTPHPAPTQEEESEEELSEEESEEEEEESEEEGEGEADAELGDQMEESES